MIVKVIGMIPILSLMVNLILKKNKKLKNYVSCYNDILGKEN
jgi:hypothetical protein